jgi:hypothetical protein
MYKNIIFLKQSYGNKEHFSAQYMGYFLLLPLEVSLRQRVPNKEITELL